MTRDSESDCSLAGPARARRLGSESWWQAATVTRLTVQPEAAALKAAAAAGAGPGRAGAQPPSQSSLSSACPAAAAAASLPRPVLEG